MSFKDIGNAINVLKGFKEGTTGIEESVIALNKLSAAQREVAITSAGLSAQQVEQISSNSALAASEIAETDASAASTAANAAQSASDAAQGAAAVGATEANVANAVSEVAETDASIAATSANAAQSASDTMQAAAATDAAGANAALAVAETAEGVASAGATSGTISLSAAIKGLVASVAGFLVANAPVIPLVLAVVAAFQRAYSAAHAYENAMESASTAKSNYESTVSELDSVNEELKTTSSRIDELQNKGSLTLTEQAELEQLQSQNAELERKATLLENVASMQQHAATSAAMDALNVSGSQSKYSKEHAAEFDGAVGYTTELQAAKEDLKYLQQLYKTREELQKRLESAAASGDQNIYDDISAQLSDTDKEISEWTTSLGDQVSQFQEYKSALEQDTNLGKISGGQEMLSELNKFINDFANVGQELTPAQEALSNIQSFFDGSVSKNAISDAILDMVKNGDSATEAVHKLGLSLDDLGLGENDSVYLDKYFDDLAKSANEAADAVNEVDGSLSGIEAAMESVNKGANFEKIGGYLSTAKDLYEQGLVGTDDFQSVAKFIAKDGTAVEAAVENFKANYDNIKKYFTTDGDGNFTKSGIDTFASDVTNAMDEAGGSFKSTAEAANALGMSTEAFEAILNRCGDYGIKNFNSQIQDMYNNLPRSAQAFAEAKDGLSALEEVYNNLGPDSEGRDMFGGMIEEWDAALAKADGDLSKFDPEIVVSIKAALDLAQIQAELDELEELQRQSGGKDIATNTAANAKRQQYINKAEANIGIGKSEELKIPVVYEQSGDALDKLYKQLEEATSEKEVIEVQAKIKDVQNIQKEILDAFTTAHPEVNFEANPEEATNTFNSWVKSAEGREVLAKITADNEEALQVIADLFNIDIDDLKVKIDAEDNTAEGTKSAQDNVNSVKQDEPAEIEAEDKTKDATSSAERSLKSIQDHKAEVLINYIWGDQEPPEDAEGLVNYLLGAQEDPETMQGLVNYIKNHQDNPDEMNAIMNYIKQYQDNPDAMSAALSYWIAHQDDPTASTASVDYTWGSQADAQSRGAPVNYTWGSQAPATNQRADVYYRKSGQEQPQTSWVATVWYKIKTVFGGGGKGSNAGTAHSKGTPNNPKRKTGQSYANGTQSGDWRLGSDQDALVNEVAPEIIVRDGRWFIANGGKPGFVNLKKNDIVFNGSQTRDLLNSGRTSSYGKFIGALNSGSAYSSGTIGGKAYASGSSSSNKNTIDWIKIALDRLEAIANKYSTRMENTFNNFNTRMKEWNNTTYDTKLELEKQRVAYKEYLAAAEKVNLSANLKKQVREGAYYVYDGYSEAEKEAFDNYKELYDKAMDAQQAIEDLTVSLGELYKQAFDIVQERYDNEFDALEGHASHISNNIDLAEARGYFANAKDYESLMSFEQRKRTKGEEEYRALTEKLNAAVASGTVAKWSDEWWEMFNATLEVAAGIQEADIALAEFQQDLNDLKWDNFDYLQDHISQLTSEADFLIKLFDEDKLLDENGNLTNEGWSVVSLHNQNYLTYMQQVEDYKKAIHELDAELASDNGNQNLIERREDLLKAEQDAILAAKDEKDAIKDLVSNAYDDLADSIGEVVNAYEDALDAAKDLYDYQKNISQATKNIAALQKQLLAYENDTSEENKARVQKIRLELEEAQTDLADTEYEHYVSSTKELLDDLQDELERVFNERVDDIDALLRDAVNGIDQNSSTISSTIQEVATAAGYEMTNSTAEILNGTGSQIQNVTSVLSEIKSYVAAIQSQTNAVKLDSNGDPVVDNNGNVSTGTNEWTMAVEYGKSATTTVTTPTTTTSATATTKPDTTASTTNATSSIFKYKKYAGNKSSLDKNNSVVDRLKYFDFDSSYTARKGYYSALGLSGTYTGSTSQNIAMLNKMKSMGYSSGGFVTDLQKIALRNGDDMISVNTLKKGEAVLSASQTELFKNFIDKLSIANAMLDTSKFIPDVSSQFAKKEIGNVENKTEINVAIDRVLDYNDFVSQMQKDPRVERIIQGMTVEQLAGRGALSKYKVK